MIYPPHPPAPWIESWLARHRHRGSFVLHMLGIPPTILGILLLPVSLCLTSASIFFLGLALFVGGYVVQFIGHGLEGTDPGEVIAIKRRLGMPYVEFASQRVSGTVSS